MENKVFLERMRSKQSTNTSSGLNVRLGGNGKLLPLNDVSDVISLMEQYSEERGRCNKIRLTCQVNPVCSNVLFNKISEIVKFEGSPKVVFLNYGIGSNADAFTDKHQVIYKPQTIEFWSGDSMHYQSVDEGLASKGADTSLNNIGDYRKRVYSNGDASKGSLHPTNAIRDTQLSRNDDEDDHFVYHCGLDILNNHLIRSNTFKAVCKMPATTEWETSNHEPKSPDIAGYTAFNTIADIMREANGNKVVEKLYFPTTSGVDGGVKFVGLHTYLYDDILPFNEAIQKKLIEKHNGWFGFSNKSKIKSYLNFGDDADPKDMRMERPIMYMNGGDHIDMYPGRDLYSFVPKYNQYRDRMEKNWNYCITYPSSSTTDGFDDIIEQSNGSLKAIYFDETTRADNGAMQLVIYSKSKHGLVPGDRVNIYKTYEDDKGKRITEKVVNNVEVDEIAGEFIFTTFTQGVQISKNWVQLSSGDTISGFTIDGKDYHVSLDGGDYFYDDTYQRYFIINDSYLNIDPDAQEISYKKVVNDIESDYYVRIFSRLPNFRFCSGDTSNEFNIYKKDDNNSSLLEEYQKPEYEFENHLSRLAFARNVYSDDIGEIVFTDDIDLSNIHDNLGRPLTDVFLTIVKNNAGYKQWYGYDGMSCEISADTVEFSHCFGKITCGLEMSYESTGDSSTNNIKVIENVRQINLGYPIDAINSDRDPDGQRHLTKTEIDFKTDVNFYGDLCCYDNYNAVESSIQPILHRFNTAQRECVGQGMGNYFLSFNYDDIKNDDYDTGDKFEINVENYINCNNLLEGYYYEPHYKIRVKSFGNLNSAMPQFLSIQAIVNRDGTTQITTQQYHFLSPGDKAMIYDVSTDRYYYLTTVRGKNDNSRIFTCTVATEKGKDTTDIDGNNIGNYKLFKIDNMNIPSYAHLLKDGTCRYIWRNVINNGSMGGDKTLEEYPFTNGAFYINRRIDIYLRRQDPYDEYGLYSEDDIFGVEPPLEEENNYANEDEIKC